MAKATGSGSEDRSTPVSESRLDRVLAAMIVGIIGLSVVAIVLYVIGTASAWPSAITTTLWAVFFFGLPVAIIIMIVVTIRISIRRRRENEQQR
ncbi:MAG TPA: hypothetical protein VNQ52_08285 [Microbacteriaceae bacterium]|nr:hypothetical protein [Microbacteriaceae bacterium]